jgi:hypothetical protein
MPSFRHSEASYGKEDIAKNDSRTGQLSSWNGRIRGVLVHLVVFDRQKINDGAAYG